MYISINIIYKPETFSPHQGYCYLIGDKTAARPMVLICDDDMELLCLFQLALETTYDVLYMISGTDRVTVVIVALTDNKKQRYTF